MNKNLHPIMLAGTGSDVGKSIITAELLVGVMELMPLQFQSVIL